MKKLIERVDRVLLKEKIVLNKEVSEKDLDILTFEDVISTEPELTGGKGSSLSILNCVKGVLVPFFFVVTTRAYKRMLSSYDIHPFIKKLQDDSLIWKKESNPKKKKELEKNLKKSARELREKIVSTQISPSLHSKIEKKYDFLTNEVGLEKGELSVAVRSSATTEDTEMASFAGLHSTYLNQKGIDNVIESMKKCWASVYTYRAVKYRIENEISHEDAFVAVVVQKMVRPQSAGTSFTIEIGSSYPGIHVAACFGLGEALVSGEVTSDEWLLNADTLQVIKQVCGSKRIQYNILENSSGVERINTPPPPPSRRTMMSNEKQLVSSNIFDQEIRKRKQKEEEKRNVYSLNTKIVKDIARITKNIGKVYEELFGYKYIDTEFAVSSTPTIYFLQARPVVPVIWEKFQTISKEVKDLSSRIIIRGKYSLLGAAHGIVKIIENFNDLAEGKISIEPNDILITLKTSNYWNQYLTSLKAICTLEGSPTAHPMLIGRERKFPCVIGCEDLIEKMKPWNGKWITLDGLTKSLYEGKLPLSEVNSEDILGTQFEVVPIEPIQDDEISKKFLLSVGRAIQVNEDIWVANKQHSFSKPEEQWTVESYQLREQMILKAMNDQEKKKKERKWKELKRIFDDRIFVRNGIVYDRYRSLSITIQAFEELTIENCESLHQDYVRSTFEFIEKGTNMNLFVNIEKGLKSFHSFIQAFKILSCHMWLSYFFRVFIDRKVNEMANGLHVSKFHLEEFQRSIQAQEIEEDNIFRKKLIEFSVLLCEFYHKHYDDDIKIESLDPLMLKQENAELFLQLRELSSSFKISPVTNLYMEIPMRECLKKIKDVIKEFEGNVNEMSKVVDQQNKHSRTSQQRYFKEMEYFPENEEFRRWVKLGIQARIIHCNAHHRRTRGTFNVVEQINRLGEEMGKQKGEIQKCTEKEIIQFIKKYHKRD